MSHVGSEIQAIGVAGGPGWAPYKPSLKVWSNRASNSMNIYIANAYIYTYETIYIL